MKDKINSEYWVYAPALWYPSFFHALFDSSITPIFTISVNYFEKFWKRTITPGHVQKWYSVRVEQLCRGENASTKCNAATFTLWACVSWLSRRKKVCMVQLISLLHQAHQGSSFILSLLWGGWVDKPVWLLPCLTPPLHSQRSPLIVWPWRVLATWGVTLSCKKEATQALYLCSLAPVLYRLALQGLEQNMSW